MEPYISAEVRAAASVNANTFLDQELSKLLAEREELLSPMRDQAFVARLRDGEAPPSSSGRQMSVRERMKQLGLNPADLMQRG